MCQTCNADGPEGVLLVQTRKDMCFGIVRSLFNPAEQRVRELLSAIAAVHAALHSTLAGHLSERRKK
eukprot:4745412-Prymnesium_polylepis.1